MQNILTDLHVCRQYAEAQGNGADEGLFAQAIRLVSNVMHYDPEAIKEHNKQVAASTVYNENGTIKELGTSDVPVPQPKQPGTPITSVLTTLPPDENHDLLTDPLKIQTHAPDDVNALAAAATLAPSPEPLPEPEKDEPEEQEYHHSLNLDPHPLAPKDEPVDTTFRPTPKLDPVRPKQEPRS